MYVVGVGGEVYRQHHFAGIDPLPEVLLIRCTLRTVDRLINRSKPVRQLDDTGQIRGPVNARVIDLLFRVLYEHAEVAVAALRDGVIADICNEAAHVADCVFIFTIKAAVGVNAIEHYAVKTGFDDFVEPAVRRTEYQTLPLGVPVANNIFTGKACVGLRNPLRAADGPAILPVVAKVLRFADWQIRQYQLLAIAVTTNAIDHVAVERQPRFGIHHDQVVTTLRQLLIVHVLQLVVPVVDVLPVQAVTRTGVRCLTPVFAVDCDHAVSDRKVGVRRATGNNRCRTDESNSFYKGREHVGIAVILRTGNDQCVANGVNIGTFPVQVEQVSSIFIIIFRALHTHRPITPADMRARGISGQFACRNKKLIFCR